MRGLLSLCLGLWFPFSACAQACEKSETACLLDAAWGAALILPEEKRDRLAAPFLEIASLTEEPELVSFWEKRFGHSVDIVRVYPDYGWQTAAPLLASGSVEELIARAERREAPLSFGRADVLLAAGIHFREDAPEKARRLNAALLSLIGSASKFEQPNLAHAAAELAMARCDLETFEDARAQTDAPDNLRYAFWRARITGQDEALLARVRAIEEDQDTREVRRVLDGYRAIQEFGYCPVRISQIGD